VQKSGTMPPPGQVADSFMVEVTDSSGLSQQMQIDIMVETNAHHVHGASGHWVAQIHPVGASLVQPVAHDESLVGDVDGEVHLLALDEQAAALGQEIHELQAQGLDSSEAEAKLDEVLDQKAALEQGQQGGQDPDPGVGGTDEPDQVETVDITIDGPFPQDGLAGLVIEETGLDFDALTSTGASEEPAAAGASEGLASAVADQDAAAEMNGAAADSGVEDGAAPVTGAATSPDTPEAAHSGQETAAAASNDHGAALDTGGAVTPDDPATAPSGEQAGAGEGSEAAGGAALEAADLLDTGAGQELDDLLAAQPEKKPIPVEGAADGQQHGTAADDAGSGPEPAAVPDSAALDSGTVDSGDDHTM
jgi:hypothetical protein